MNRILQDIYLSQLNYINKNEIDVFIKKKDYIIVELENSKYCIDMAEVGEIINKVEIVRLPLTPDFVKGIFHLRGDIITNLSLQNILGIQENTYDENARVIVCHYDDITISFFVNRVRGSISTDAIMDTNLDSKDKCIKGILKPKGTNPIAVLDIEQIAKINQEEQGV